MKQFFLISLSLLFFACSDTEEAVEYQIQAPAEIQELGDTILKNLEEIRGLNRSIDTMHVFLDLESVYNVESSPKMGDYNPYMQQMGFFQEWQSRNRSLEEEYFKRLRYWDGKMGGYFMLDAAPDRITLVANDTSTSYYSDIVEDSYYHKTIAHELTHLLQYQNNFFGHWYEMSYVDEWLRGNNLTEGDACFTMDLYHAEMYNDSVNLDSLVQFERDEVTIFEDYLSRNILGDYHIFFLVSYLYGTQYIAEMYQQYGWDTINTMHMVNDFLPNQLLTDGTVFDEVEVDLSSLDGSVSNRSIFAEDIFGSAILSALLNTYSTSPAQEKIAAFREQYGWRGDKIRMYESEENYCYVWSVVFDSDSSAQRMHDIVHVQNTTKSTESRPLLTLDNSEVINDSTTVYSYSSSGFSSYHLVQGAQMWIVENPVQDIDTILNRIIN